MTFNRLVLLAAVVPWLAANRIDAQSPAPRASADQSALELSRSVRGLTTTARVLVVGMHPDDEDTQLITWLSRGKNIETAYLSITRGEAGANFGGSESGNTLGAIRTEEALASRRIDGAQQYFTRAFDFGSARNEADAFKRWNRDSIIGDVVAVIRSFRPQVIIALLPDSAIDGDGQHQALEWCVNQAFLASTSVGRFPVDPFGMPWLVSRMYRPGRGFTVEMAGYDRASGKTFGELAIESRGQQRSQGLHDLTLPKSTHVELRRLMPKTADSIADKSLFSGLDTSFMRLGRYAPQSVGESALSIAAYADSAQRALDVLNPSAAVPFLAQIVRFASTARSALPWCRHPSPIAAPPVLPHGDCDALFLFDADATIDLVAARAGAALLAATGVSLDVSADRDLVAGDDTIPVTLTLSNHGTMPATFADVAVWGNVDARMKPIIVPPDSSVRVTAHVHGLPNPHPWWVGSHGGKNRGGERFGAVLSSVDGLLQTDLIPAARTLLGVAVPENIRRTSDATAVVTVAGATVTTSLGPIVHRHADAGVGLQNRSVAGVPNVTLQFARGLEWIPRTKPLTRALRVAIKSHSDREQDFALKILTPKGMPLGVRIDSLPATLHLAPHEDRELFVQLRGTPLETDRLPIALVGIPRGAGPEEDKQYQTGLKVIQREYLPPIRLMPTSGEWIQPIDITVPPNLTTLYVPANVDDIAPAIRQVGGWVTEIESTDQLLSVDLTKVSTIAIGARAFDVHPELLGQAGRLLEFVRKGGTLVVLRGDEPTIASRLFPYPLTLGRPLADRAMQPDAPITVLDPASRLLNWPNKIVPSDWGEWIGERAQLMPSTADPRYRSVIEVHDAGQRENRNAILSARVGKGTIIYTTLTLEQQIAGGIPGGLRLFVNLLSAGLSPR